MFKLQSPEKYFSFDAIQDFFPTAQNNFWMCQFWCLLVLLLCFVSPLPPCQNSSLWGLFSSREANKKITEGQIRWLGRVGHGGHAVFGQKLLATQHCVGRCTRKSSIVKWAMMLKESSKNSLKPNTASHNTSWCTDTDGFLEHSPSWGSLYYKGPALQKIITGFWGVPFIKKNREF